jgi:hypothetical protein
LVARTREVSVWRRWGSSVEQRELPLRFRQRRQFENYACARTQTRTEGGAGARDAAEVLRLPRHDGLLAAALAH